MAQPMSDDEALGYQRPDSAMSDEDALRYGMSDDEAMRVGQSQSSTAGAVVRGVERGAIPGAAGLAGAEAGAVIGAVGGPIGSVAGALVGGLGGGYLAGKAQDYIVHHLPESWQRAIGQDEETEKADEAQHPYASMAGEVGSNLLMMRPGAVVEAAEDAPKIIRAMSSPVGARATGAAFGAGQEAVQEKLGGEDLDPGKLAIAAGAGALMNRPTRAGELVVDAGQRLAQPVADRFGAAFPGSATGATPESDVDTAQQELARASASEQRTGTANEGGFTDEELAHQEASLKAQQQQSDDLSRRGTPGYFEGKERAEEDIPLPEATDEPPYSQAWRRHKETPLFDTELPDYPGQRAIPPDQRAPQAPTSRPQQELDVRAAGANEPVREEPQREPEQEPQAVADELHIPYQTVAGAASDVRSLGTPLPHDPTLLQTIRGMGGIKVTDSKGNISPEGTVIQSILDKRSGLYRSLVNNKTGKSPDYMREALDEDGWFGGAPKGQEIDVNDFFDLLNQASREDVYHPNSDVAPARGYRNQLLDEMQNAGVNRNRNDPNADDLGTQTRKLAAYRHDQNMRAADAQALIDRANHVGIADPSRYHPAALRDLVEEREAIMAEGSHNESDADQLERGIRGDLSHQTAREGVGFEPGEIAGPDETARGSGREPVPGEAAARSGEAAGPGGRDARTAAPGSIDSGEPLDEAFPKFAIGAGDEGVAEPALDRRVPLTDVAARQDFVPKSTVTPEGTRLVYRPEFEARSADLANSLQTELGKMGLGKIAVRVADEIRRPGGEVRANAYYWQRMITMALDTKNPLGILNHEVVHALKDMGLFTPGEWRILEAEARRKWTNDPEIAERLKLYPDVTPENRLEEAVAMAAERGPAATPSPFAARIFSRVRDFSRALSNALRGNGFATPESIFRDIREGRFGERLNAREGEAAAKFALSREAPNTPEFRKWFGGSKAVDEQGRPLVLLHGASRPDRIGDRFRKSRATSGPMPFFTDDPAIASKYAEGKADTSLSYENPDYTNWFRIKLKGARAALPLDRAWHYLPESERQHIAALAPRVGRDYDTGENLVLHPEGTKSGLGGYDQHIKEARGNHLKALVEEWLNSGALFNDEEEFAKVLKMAGVDRPVEIHDPNATNPGVYPVHLSIQRPLETADIPGRVVDALDQASRRQRTQPMRGADIWDKANRDPREWVQQLRENTAAGKNSFVWSSIPDWVTRTLQSLGYDGIHDSGGKAGGPGHGVWIPFEENQVKSVHNRGTFDPAKKNIMFSRREPEEEPGAVDARGKPLPQLVIPGAERSAKQAAASRETGSARIAPKAPQKAAGGLFSEPEAKTPDLFGGKFSLRPPPAPPKDNRVYRNPNVLEQMVMGARRFAEQDTNGARLINAYDAKDAEVHSRIDTLRGHISGTFLKLPDADRDKVYAAAELRRLTGAPPLSGQERGYAIANRNFDLAAKSKTGDVVRLNRTQTKALYEMQQMFAHAWTNVAEGLARRNQWNGPWSDDMAANIDRVNRAAETADHPRERRAWNRLAVALQAIEDQRRDGYIPLSRNGDYYVHVTPKLPKAGEEIPRTAWFSLSERPPLQDLTGGKPVPQTPDYAKPDITKAESMFPGSEYRIKHGFLSRDPSMLKDVDIPAIDKLFMLMESGVTNELKGRNASGESGSPKDEYQRLYGELTDAFMDELYRQKTAGYKRQARNTPGYSANFDRAVGSYMNWNARHVAGAIHDDAIESTYNQTQTDLRSPSTARNYWKNWKQAMDTPSTPFEKLVNGTNRIGFLYTLAMNPATTLLVGLHGPLYAIPVLSKGVGVRTAAREFYRAYGHAFAAATSDRNVGLHLDIEKLASRLPPAEAALLRQADAEGLLHSKATDDIRSLSETALSPMGAMAGQSRKWMDILSSNIAVADQLNRVASVLSAFRTAGHPGQKVWDENQLWADEKQRSPENFARFMLPQMVGAWGKSNASPLGRAPLGRSVVALHGFIIRFLSNLYDMSKTPEGRKAFMWTMAALWAGAGLEGIPFAKDAEDAYDAAFRHFAGKDPMIHNRLQQMIADTGLGKTGANVVLRGVPSAIIDLSSRMGVGDVIGKEVSDTFPLVAPNILGRAIYSLGAGDIAGALPAFIRNPLRAAQSANAGVKSQTGRTTYLPQEKVTPADVAAKALGFTSANERNARDYQEYGYRMRSDRRARVTPTGGPYAGPTP